MFTWICPKCGSEVPPSENECPNCRSKSAPAPAARVKPVSAPAPAVPPAPAHRPVSPVLIAIGSAGGILALLAYLYVLPRGSSKSTTAALENPGPAGSPAVAPANPLAKYFEITGLRVMEDGDGQAKIGYLVVNTRRRICRT